MPELPEVETTCRGIEQHCLNSSINDVLVRQHKLRWPIDKSLTELLSGKKIIQVTRRGKYLQLQFEQHQLMVHLGMSGSLRIVKSDVTAGKHDHVDIILDNGKIIRYNDPRRFGCILYNQQGLQHSLLAKLGVEPLSEDFNEAYLVKLAQGRKVAIKTFIMNSHIVVGVGNIYAQEALFRAGIHPNRAANKISLKRMGHLVATIRQVLEEAIKAGGSSLKDFTSTEGKPGYFQHRFQVYGRGGESCLNCSKPLKLAQIGQRTTAYCGSCQR